MAQEPAMNTLKPRIIILLILFYFFEPIASYSQQAVQRLDNTTDQQSLLSFKTYITRDPFGVLNNWNTNISFCNWIGVTCNIKTQRVTGINLENFNLAGTISPYIGNLSFVSFLNLHNNSFYGTLPHDLGRLSQLQNLSLSYNLIEGVIPSSLRQCKKLVRIDLRNNKMEGSIPRELSGLLKLQILHLGYNFLSGLIPPSLGNLSSITNLVLSGNSLKGPIPEELGHLPQLLNLQIEQTNISGKIPPSVFNSSSLVWISLALNKLSGTLPSDIFSTLPSLTIFLVARNNLTGHIPSSLANASKLVTVDFSINSFSGRIPLLSNLLDIQKMNLEKNQLTSEGEGGMDFMISLANSPKLRALGLDSNRLTGKLPSQIGNLSKELTLLFIGDNKLGGSLPTEISKLVGLTGLGLSMNSFTGIIPSSIAEMPVLHTLLLDNNMFSGNIPESLGNITHLYNMRLNQNNLTGSIPASLGNCQQLQIVYLSGNMLSGIIPREIFNIPSFVLNLSSNSFTGSVPTDIGKLEMIEALDLSHNKLSGEIPLTIGDCLSLSYLDLSVNSFQGSIPNTMGNLKAVEYIDLSSNSLSGRIPSSLKSLKFMQVLDLSMNQLEGEIPMEGIFVNSTLVSLGGNPKLCGGVSVLELPNCPVSEKHSGGRKMKLIIGILLGFLVFGALLSLVLLVLCKRTTRKPKANNSVISFEGPHRLYTYHDLRIATGYFNKENFIGEGSSGRVYKGILTDGTPAAIKVFKMEQHGALESFLSECEALRNVRHRNLVRIMSACSSSEFKALVLQFMSNGSLDQWLKRSFEFNTWDKLEVAKDIAFALEYMHHDCETPVVHCDLKPSNILLDENMTAYVGDFGLAKRLLTGSKENPPSGPVGLNGSIGYIAPEYGFGGDVSSKGDVYSYGILLLEMFTGKRPTDNMFIGELDLQKWVSIALPDGIMNIVDVELFQEDELQCLVSVMNIGLACAAKSPEGRPTMRNVSTMIITVRDKLLTIQSAGKQ